MATKKPLEIDMCAGSQRRDTQGEMLDVEGADISNLTRLNDNHGAGFFNSIGLVTEAKKIFKAEDCDNDRHKYYWNKIGAPYIYVRGRLYDDEDHPNARAAAAILRNIHKTDSPLQLKASVEGGVISRGLKDPSLLTRTKIHSIALTFTPANNATLVEPISLDKSYIDEASDMLLIKSVLHLAQTNVPSFRHIARDASATKVQQNITKLVELMKDMGIEGELIIPSKQAILEKALEQRIKKNVEEINEAVKQLSKSVPKLLPIDDNTKKTVIHQPKPVFPHQAVYQPEKEKVSDESLQGYKVRAAAIDHATDDWASEDPIKRRPRVTNNRAKAKTAALKIAQNRYNKLKAEPKPNLTKAELDAQEVLDKGVKSAIAGAALSAATAISPMKSKTPPPPMAAKVQQASAVQPAAKTSPHETMFHEISKIDPLMGAIGCIESSCGKNLKHEKITDKNSMHYGHTAGGIFGMLPNTAAFIVRKDHELAKKYPDLAKAAANVSKNHMTYTDRFNKDPQAAADFAMAMMKRNRSKTKNDHMAAYSWLNGLKGSWNKYHKGGMKAIKANPYVQKVMDEHSKMQPQEDEQNISLIRKALTAGSGGAGAPSSLTGGGVMQSESLDDGRPGFKYFTCDGCGKEQIYAKHQIKCRECGRGMSLEKIFTTMGKK
jgi:hypothetical protein